jgi:hypothetical protein
MHLDDVLTELVEHCGDRLLRVAYQLTHDAAAAQDLVQEALLPWSVPRPGLVRAPSPAGTAAASRSRLIATAHPCQGAVRRTGGVEDEPAGHGWADHEIAACAGGCCAPQQASRPAPPGEGRTVQDDIGRSM